MGASYLFANAGRLASMGAMDSAQERYALGAADLLADGVVLSTFPSLDRAPLRALRGPTTAQADALAAALDVADVREMSLWPPYLAARTVVSALLGSVDGRAAPEMGDAEDLAAEALRPELGKYPTERLYYSTLVMLGPLADNEQPGTPLAGAGPLDLATLPDAAGLTGPALGAMLSFEQSWYAQGVTLGQLLHSLALAPGEATRIAVIDWARRTSALEQETVSQAEQLDNSTMHSRSISEVQNAVADEAQNGFSNTDTSASSSSMAGSASAGTGLLTSLVASGDVSVSGQSAQSQGSSTSQAWTTGHRQLEADLTQKVQDRTEQHASSTRNRRAAAVREVSQSEHESVSTRIVANYNHMHALTVQYWEVVELFRVVCRLHRAERVLFVPITRVTFDGRTIDRFRTALRRAALTSRAADLLADPVGSIAVRPVQPVRSPNRLIDLVQAANRAVVADRFRLARVARLEPDLLTPAARFLAAPAGTGVGAVAAQSSVEAATGGLAEALSAAAEPSAVAAVGGHLWMWSPSHISEIALATGVAALRPNSDDVYVPADAIVESIAFRDGNASGVVLEHGANGDTPLTLSAGIAAVPPGVTLGDINAISTAVDAPGTMILALNRGGRRFTVEMPVQASAALTRGVIFSGDAADRAEELRKHLTAHADHYNQAIWRSLGSAEITALVAGLEFEGESLSHKVDPVPISVAGNYLVLRAPAELDDRQNPPAGQQSWTAQLRSRLGIPSGMQDERLIPLPSGGVFAEAVLGRSNSAEKLDITRFWHWKDSPIPLAPPDIAPVSTGSRATAEDLKPGDLSQPLVNIVSPTTLPNPDSSSALLSALATGSMFRDMSGLAGNQQLVGNAISGTLQAATQAGEINSENMRTEAQKSVAMGQIWGDIIKSAMGAATGTGGGGSSSVTPITGGGAKMSGISAAGAQINHGRDLDGRGLGLGTASTGSSAGGSGIVAGGSSNGSGPVDGSGAGAQPGGAVAGQFSHEAAYADQNALGFSPEAAGGLSDLIEQAQYRTTANTSPVPGRAVGPVSVAPPSDAVLTAANSVTFTDALSVEAWFTGNTGSDFPTWFAANVGGRGAWSAATCRSDVTTVNNFERLMDLISAIYGPTIDAPQSSVAITLPQMLSLAAIAINETRTFVPIAEMGSLRYMFEPNAASGKASYNVKPDLQNRTAASLFQDPDFQSAHSGETKPQGFNASDPAWASTAWPTGMPANPQDPRSAYLRQADFWKFRGHGFIQLTGRVWFRNLLQQIRAYSGGQPVIGQFSQAWATGNPDTLLTRSTDADWETIFTGSDLVGAALGVRAHTSSLNATLALSSSSPATLRASGSGSLFAVGRAMNGSAYGMTFQRRVFQMLNALGPVLAPPPAPSSAGGTPI
ncbi:hypothetical protein [Streptomyces sp. NPDC086182]|uniref:hypothetical protein n=1 Tax=Streptomyces sp. NPDC086182 TaxID=3155058 RepID=UPI00343B3EDF